LSKQDLMLLIVLIISFSTYLQHIIEHASQSPDVAKSIYRERDPGRNTAHHLAARARNLNMLKVSICLSV